MFNIQIKRSVLASTFPTVCFVFIEAQSESDVYFMNTIVHRLERHSRPLLCGPRDHIQHVCCNEAVRGSQCERGSRLDCMILPSTHSWSEKLWKLLFTLYCYDAVQVKLTSQERAEKSVLHSSWKRFTAVCEHNNHHFKGKKRSTWQFTYCSYRPNQRQTSFLFFFMRICHRSRASTSG